MTPEDAAELLHVTRRWIVEAAARGELPALKLGRVWRFDRRDLNDWLDAQRVAARKGVGL